MSFPEIPLKSLIHFCLLSRIMIRCFGLGEYSGQSKQEEFNIFDSPELTPKGFYSGVKRFCRGLVLLFVK